MATKTLSSQEVIVDLLQKSLIIELAKQGVPQNDIARIVGIHITKVSTVLKYFKPKKK